MMSWLKPCRRSAIGDEAIAGIQEGLSDLDAGRVRSLGDVDAELRTKYGISHNA